MIQRKGNYYHSFMTTPIGEILLIKNEKALVSISLFEDEHESHIKIYQSEKKPELFKKEISQLTEYFERKRKHFDLILEYEGTDFQKQVWNALQQIPYGETRSYKDVAQLIHNPKAVRGVGQANRRNHLPLIIPCHRVIASSGKLIGFGGQHTDIQRKLLALEQGELQHV